LAADKPKKEFYSQDFMQWLIFTVICKTVLGWKYEQAYESSQKYKEGKFIIELAHMIKENGWENES